MDVLVVEDVHWADEATLEFLLFLRSRQGRQPSIVVSYRPEDLPGDSPLLRLSSRSPVGATGLRLTVPPLAVDETVSLVSSMLFSRRVSAEFAAFLQQSACAGINGQVVCAGGTDADTNTSLKSTYIYDPGSNTWSQGADMPFDDWAMAYSGSGNQLQIAGGVTNNNATVTNQAAEYDPSSNSWSALPNANNAEYRGGGSCGLYKIGGSTGQFAAQNFAEVLPGFDSCGTEDVPWLSESTGAFTLSPGQSQTVAVTMDSSAVSQPGAYAAKLTIGTDSPYQFAPIGVAMQANPPAAWSKVAGTVTDASTGNPIAGATVQICTQYNKSTGTCGQVTYTLKTDSSGNYQLWLNRGFNPLQIIAAKDGYQPATKLATLIKGVTTTVNFALNKS